MYKCWRRGSPSPDKHCRVRVPSFTITMSSSPLQVIGYLTLFTYVIISQPVLAGSCWRNVGHKALCTELISARMTRQQCCEAEPKGEKFYSDDESSYTTFDLKFYLAPHKCRAACKDGCKTFQHRCQSDEICRVKNGIPKCLCNPSCARNSLSRKGKVCGTDGRTYRSHCQLLRQKCRKKTDIQVNYFGSCQVSSCIGIICAKKGAHCTVDQYNSPICVSTPTKCDGHSNTQHPVCATNNRTFKSVCHLNEYNIKHGRDLRVQYHSACKDAMSCHKDEHCKHCLFDNQSGSYVCKTNDCPTCDGFRDSVHVCGTDGKTYQSECMLRRNSCINKVYLTVKHIADCNASRKVMLWSLINSKRERDDVFERMVLERRS